MKPTQLWRDDDWEDFSNPDLQTPKQPVLIGTPKIEKMKERIYRGN